MKAKRMWMGVGLAACLAACREASPPAADERAAPLPAALPDPGAGIGPATSYARATQALAENRMLSPAGDNAVEHYLAARAQPSERPRAQAALAELQPYVLIAAEQALARGDAPEARRLHGLIARIDARAPALPRLRAGVAALAREQAAQAAAAVRETPPPAVPGMPAAVRTTPAPAGPPAMAARPEAAAPAMPAIEPVPPPPPASTATADTAEPVHVPAAPRPGTETRTPRLLQDAPPRYPLPALRARIEGEADVAFTIQPDGSVRDVRLLSSTPAGLFDASAIAVAQRWRFEATGQAHASRRTVRFRLPAEARGG